MQKKIIEVFKFFGISGIGWTLDMCIYSILTMAFKFNAGYSNIFSSLVAVTFVFIFSSHKIFFNKKNTNLKAKYAIYVIYQIFVICLSSFIISFLASKIVLCSILLFSNYSQLVAKILITPFVMITNYLVMKNLIEKV